MPLKVGTGRMHRVLLMIVNKRQWYLYLTFRCGIRHTIHSCLRHAVNQTAWVLRNNENTHSYFK